MPTFKPLFAAGIAAGFIVALFSAGYAAGQNGRKPETKEQADWKLQTANRENETRVFWAALASKTASPDELEKAIQHQDSAFEIARLYHRAVRSPDLSEAAASSAVDSYAEELAEGKQPRVSQTQLRLELLQIAQNQRIIELLERQAAGKK